MRDWSPMRNAQPTRTGIGRALAVFPVALVLSACSSPSDESVSVESSGTAGSLAEVAKEEAELEQVVKIAPEASPAEGATVGDASTADSAPGGTPPGAPPDGPAPAGGTGGGSDADPAKLEFVVAPGEWPMWGGSLSRNMVNLVETGIPHDWNVETGKNIKWVAELGSQSYGNPTVAEGHVLVGTNNERLRNPKIPGDKGVVLCLREADGKFLWQATHDKLEAGRVNDWPEQGICSSPVVQDGRVYYVSNRCELVCADLEGLLDGENDGPFVDEKYQDPIDGDFIWIYDMIAELGVFPHNLATSSPLVVGDLVYILTSNGVERDHITIPSPLSPSFIAVHKKTGELVWESVDPGENILHGQWSCPTFGVAGGKPQVVFPGGDGWLYAYEPLGGELIWKFDCNPKDSVWKLGGMGTRNNLISTPVFVNGHVYISVGQDPEHGEGIGHLYSVDASGTGDVTGSHQVWHYGGKDFRRSISTVAVHDGLVYAADLSGFLQCLDQKTGKPYWIHDTLAAVWGSPTVIDGKVFLGDEDGDVLVLQLGKEKKVLAEEDHMNLGASVYTTPVAAKGVLYIATRTKLYAIAEAK